MGGPRITEQQKLRILDLARRGWSTRRIQAALADESPDGRSPDHGTIARYVKRSPLPERVVPWRLRWPDDPGEIAYLFRLLALDPDLDWDTARWALRLRVALGREESEKDILRHLAVAMLYALRDLEMKVLGKDVRDTADIDAYLMFRAWESPERTEQYWTAVRAGRVPAMSGERQLRALVVVEYGPDSEHLTQLKETGGWGYLKWLHETAESQEQGRLTPLDEALIDVVIDMATDPKGPQWVSDMFEQIVEGIDTERREEEKGGQCEGKSSEAGEGQLDDHP